ncbi:uncharacterized protein KY384_000149 [Bacidia gigantensis]|uniref:uncharacterized protein n=1 Tax=Bacidia gigantensis TaxID=2732470 RepID=UPI001D039EA4|nr:uncharacterized protein KY384_000149 [Bacidia gigantensis]KAG8526156.1 hypothetical protein KY384_000149 [Bacidia gigantensis]
MPRKRYDKQRLTFTIYRKSLGSLECTENLELFRRKLEKLSPQKRNKAAVVWQNVKSMIQEKELDRMSRLVQDHLTTLQLQLRVLEGNRIEDVQMLANRLIALVTDHEEHRRESASTFADSMRIGHETTYSSLQNHSNSFQQFGDKFQDFSTTLAGSMRKGYETTHSLLQNCTNAVQQQGDKMQELSSLSVDQNANLQRKIELLLERLPPASSVAHAAMAPTEDLPRQTSEDTSRDDRASMAPNAAVAEDGLQEALQRLSQLAHDTDKIVFSEAAEAIIDDIEQILAQADQESLQASRRREGKRKKRSYDDIDEVEEKNLQRNVKRMSGHLVTSHCITVNEKGRSTIHMSLN